MKKAHIWIMVLAILFSMAAIVEAKDTYRVDKAFANFSDLNSTYIYVVKSDTGTLLTNIYVNQHVPGGKYWVGYKSTTENVFNMDRPLNTAILSPVYIDMYEILNGPFVKTIKIQTQWTGIDKIQNDRYLNVKLRNATATGSVNDIDIGQTNDAALIREETYK